MNLRWKITLQFTAIVALLMIAASTATYLISVAQRHNDFYDRLERQANIIAKLLVEVEEINTEVLFRIEQDNPSSLPFEKIKIYSSGDSLLFNTDIQQEIPVSAPLLEALHQGNKREFIVGDYEVLGLPYSEKGQQFAVIAAAQDVNGFRKMNRLLLVLLIVFASSLMVCFGAGWFFAGRALRPISRVIMQVNDINASRLNLRLDEGNRKDEIARLAATFNRLLDRIESAFKLQRTFIANASHELRTPLTSITGQLEVTLLKSRTEEEYRKVIDSVLEDMKNLNTLSNKLLQLAQASGEPDRSEFSLLRFDEVLWQSRSDLLRAFPEYRIVVEISQEIEDDRQLTIEGNEQLLRTALLNLLDNGCKYSALRSVVVQVEPAKGQLRVTFTDQGIGIPEEDLRYIVEPFFRAKNTSNQKGHGIGLSLVQRILIIHNASMSIHSEVGKGTQVVLLFNTIS